MADGMLILLVLIIQKIKYSLENAVRNKSGWFGIYNSLNQSLIIFRGDCFSYAPTNSIDIFKFKLIEPVAEIFNRMRYIGIGVKWEGPNGFLVLIFI